ncbi:uncharacterized protein BX663DRAFT_549319 [Cokeromyces recurvatus]|uniref:uncharacterized protein n=1 Tax=Cokeromyces recurvatus TaxID=90255 RepID=UPI0022207932|nr:uncharacterized protein BX663DRAFT_549319 [Cokeromyces recurvatus]KAI7906227.1 hypothetical protein BX663DRAFT_549319 [Cokeromyces recurvatus]
MSSLEWLNVNDLQLKQSIEKLINEYPASSQTIQRLVQYYENNNDNDRDAKRRKLDQSIMNNELLRLDDISFQLPARKKYDLIITKPNETRHVLLYNNKTNKVEFQYTVDQFSHLGGACVLTPDKAIKTYTYTLFLTERDCLVFTTQEKTDITIKKSSVTEIFSSDQKHVSICELLTEFTSVPIAQPSKDYFTSTGDNKPTENKDYVVAYHKAKDGFLFFLPTGILFGFKKPTIFVPASSLMSTVITSVTNRTFDFMLKLRPEAVLLGSSGFRTTKEGDEDTIQFSMIEQSEYEGIEAYTKKLNINDHSMLEERKAPVNKKQQRQDEDVEMLQKEDLKGKGKERVIDQPPQQNNEDSDEYDEDFEPSSDEEHDPLEYDTDADEEEADRELAGENIHEFQDAVFNDQDEEEEEEEQLLDESD